MKKSLIAVLAVLAVMSAALFVSCARTPVPVKFTVTYELGYDGEAPEKLVVDEGSEIVLPEVSREGYTFLGWEEDGKVYPAASSYKVVKKTVFSASWELNEYTVSYSLGYDAPADLVPAPETVEYGNSVTLPEVSRKGYTFLGWDLEGVHYDANDEYAPADNVTFTATWQVNEYTVSYSLGYDAPAEDIPAPETVEYGNSVTLPEVSRKGYTFLGWDLEGAHYDANDEYAPEDNVTFTASWAAIMHGIEYYTGIYNNSGITGSAPEAPVEAQEGSEVTLPECSWNRQYYEFIGWKVQHYNTDDPEDEYWEDISDLTNLQPGATFTMPAYDVRICALWNLLDITINYDPNGGEGSIPSATKKANATLNSNLLPDGSELTPPAGEKFAGWSLEKDGEAISSCPAAEWSPYVVDKTLTLYAVWEILPIDLQEIIGVWTSEDGQHELILTDKLVDSASGFEIALIGIRDGEYLEFMNGTTALFDSTLWTSDNAFTIKPDAGGIFCGRLDQTDTINYTHKSEISDVDVSEFAGNWTKQGMNQKYYIDGESVAFGTNFTKASIATIDKYAIISNGIYRHILKKDGENLVGKYSVSDPEKMTSTDVTFEPGDWHVLKIDGVLKQFVDAGQAPAALAEPEAEAGKKFDGWVIVGSEEPFDPSLTLDKDVDITAKFVDESAAQGNKYVGEVTMERKVLFSVNTYVFTVFELDPESMKLTYTVSINGAAAETKTVDYETQRGGPDEVETYYVFYIGGTMDVYFGLTADGNSLILCDEYDDPIGTLTRA